MNMVLCTCIFKSKMLVIVGAEIKGMSRDVISHIRAFKGFKGHFGLYISSVRDFCLFSLELWLDPEGPLRSLQWMFWILSFHVWRWFTIELLSTDDRYLVHLVLGHHHGWHHSLLLIYTHWWTSSGLMRKNNKNLANLEPRTSGTLKNYTTSLRGNHWCKYSQD